MCLTDVDLQPDQLPSPRSRAILPICVGVDLFLDRWLMKHHFGQTLVNRPARVPKLWDRCAMRELSFDSAVAPWLALARGNKIRTPTSDVSAHLQYEAMLVERGHRVTTRLLSQSPRDYHFVAFAPARLDSTPMGLLSQLERVLLFTRPLFVCIESEVSGDDVDSRMLPAKRALLERVMMRVWHSMAAWERPP